MGILNYWPSTDISTLFSSLQPYSTYIWVLLLIILYAIYLAYFKYHKIIVQGNYDTKLKKMGKTLPPFPNGWYIACKSSDLKVGESIAIDQSGVNITLFRNTKTKQVYGIHSYCAHIGANLGIGGKVVNEKCIQCPFHGWMYDGTTGALVDYDGKQVQTMNVRYNDEIGQQGCKGVQWLKGKQGNVKLKTYYVKQNHGFIYVWIHCEQNRAPDYEFINVEKYQKQLNARGFTQHTIRSHAQDIPENGCDAFHFRYVHKYPISGINWLQFLWIPDWKTGDDVDLPKLFIHPSKDIHKFKQGLYKDLVEPLQNKENYSFANIDNYVTLPIIGKIFIFNLSVMQMGPGLVYVFLKTHFFTVLFIQFLQTKQPTKQVLYHYMFASNWLPYWLTSVMLRGQAIQVTNDMYIWDSKKFGHHIYYKENEADRFILNWRKWFSKFYEGCKEKKDRELIDW